MAQLSSGHAGWVKGRGSCTAEISRSEPGSVSGQVTTSFLNFPSDKFMPGCESI